MELRTTALATALLAAGLAASCIRVGAPMLVPPTVESARSEWRPMRGGMEGASWVSEFLFLPGRSEQTLDGADLSVLLDDAEIPFRFNEDYQRLTVLIESPAPGPHTLEVRPAASASHPFPRLTLKITVPR